MGRPILIDAPAARVPRVPGLRAASTRCPRGGESGALASRPRGLSFRTRSPSQLPTTPGPCWCSPGAPQYGASFVSTRSRPVPVRACSDMYPEPPATSPVVRGPTIQAMPRNKLRRLHLSIQPPVTARIAGRQVTFVGLNLLNNVVMVEYDVDPPLRGPDAFGPRLLCLTVTDDVTEDPYPTEWEDFHHWPEHGPNRVTTRLDRRPPAAARRLHFEVRSADAFAPQVRGRGSDSLRSAVSFDVDLPADHGAPRSAPSGRADGVSHRSTPQS